MFNEEFFSEGLGSAFEPTSTPSLMSIPNNIFPPFEPHPMLYRPRTPPCSDSAPQDDGYQATVETVDLVTMTQMELNFGPMPKKAQIAGPGGGVPPSIPKQNPLGPQ